MLRKKTVFVVGSGASNELDLPVGADLALQISRKLDVLFDDWGDKQTHGDVELFGDLRRAFPQDVQAYQQSAWVIRDGIVLANSIDDFLDVHKADEKVVRYGKSAIAKCILEAEAKSKLYFDPDKSTSPRRETVDFRKSADTWLVKLMRLLGRSISAESHGQIFDQATFVVFNYDRCVEQFFLNALQPMFRISDRAAADIVASAKIVHPYGLAGQFPLPGRASQGPKFGMSRADCCVLSSQVKTYSESVDSAAARSLIEASERIVFLGFAFHEQNLKLLSDVGQLHGKAIFGTAWGMSDSDVKIVTDELTQLFKSNIRSRMASQIHLHRDLKAAELFDYYSKTL